MNFSIKYGDVEIGGEAIRGIIDTKQLEYWILI